MSGFITQHPTGTPCPKDIVTGNQEIFEISFSPANGHISSYWREAEIKPVKLTLLQREMKQAVAAATRVSVIAPASEVTAVCQAQCISSLSQAEFSLSTVSTQLGQAKAPPREEKPMGIRSNRQIQALGQSPWMVALLLELELIQLCLCMDTQYACQLGQLKQSTRG